MKHCILAALVLVPAVLGAHAQVTTRNLTGLMKDAKIGPSVEAAVRALHGRSGTTYGVATKAGGQFATQNMRIGGPCTVEVSYVGARATTRDVLLLPARPTC